MLKILSALLAVASLQGCALRDARDRPWDPPPGRSLFEQIPNWDNAAQKICCGHLDRCGPGQSPRC
jgi:hypothetical protein